MNLNENRIKNYQLDRIFKADEEEKFYFEPLTVLKFSFHTI